MVIIMNLKEIRKQRNLTQSDIGKILKLDKSQIHKIEKEKSKLNSNQIIKLCYAMNITSDYLLGLINFTEEKKRKGLD